MRADGDSTTPSAWSRFGWALASASNMLVGVFIGLALGASDLSVVGRAAAGTFGLFMILIAAVGFMTRVVRPSRAATARRVALVEEDVVVRLRRTPEACMVMLVPVIGALLVEGAIAAYAARLMLLAVLVGVAAVLAVAYALDAVVALRWRREIRMSETALTVCLGVERADLRWDDVASVEREVQRVYTQGGTVRNAFLRIELAPGASPVWTRRRLLYLVPRRYRRARIRISEVMLDDLGRVREVLIALARLDETGRRSVLAPLTVAYLSGGLDISPLPTLTGRSRRRFR